MSKSKMASSPQRILVITTIISLIMLAGTCEAQESSGPGSGGGGSPGVLPISTATPGESGLVDPHNRSVTQGLFGLISPAIWPATYSFLTVCNFLMQVFIGQKLPCTLWSVAPPRMQCTLLD